MTEKKKPLPDKDEGREQKTNDEVGIIYPATAAAVNRSCQDCYYLRMPANPRRKPFCLFTGGKDLPPDGCTFFRVGGGVPC